MKRFRVVGLLSTLIALSLLLTIRLAAQGGILGTPPVPATPPVFSELEPRQEQVQQVTYLPWVTSPVPWVNTENREVVKQFYLTEYLASEGVPSGWNGDHDTCDSGTTTAEFREAVLRRINYFRLMSGLPPVLEFKSEYNQKAQDAALMMSVNAQLSHTPPPTWLCYTASGYQGAGSSNLFLGVFGPQAMSGYIWDFGANNYPVGHRRWILYPQTRYMGTGDIPFVDNHPAANALWVFDLENMWGPRPTTRDMFVAWPPPGYVPVQVTYPRWSFSYPNADFTNATVTMTVDGQPSNIQVNDIVNGYGENTIVWEPQQEILDEAIDNRNDVVTSISIQNVIINAVPHDFAYEVIVFDPTQ